MNAEQIFDELVVKDKILSQIGQITFHLDNVSLIIKQKDVVGNIIQEWLQAWFEKKGIPYALNSNTQMPPDFYLIPENKKAGLLEIKAFNYKASPGFDIADFKSFEKTIIEQPELLFTDYLIFGYEMKANGDVVIKNVWLKKVWELTSPMKDWPIKLQVKNSVVHKIRPAKWYSKKLNKPIFKSLEHFLSALEETVFKDNDTHNDFPTWRNNFVKNYKKVYNTNINIPKWCDIEKEYDI